MDQESVPSGKLCLLWHLVGGEAGQGWETRKSWVQRAVTDLRLAAGAKLASPHVRAVRFGTSPPR